MTSAGEPLVREDSGNGAPRTREVTASPSRSQSPVDGPDLRRRYPCAKALAQRGLATQQVSQGSTDRSPPMLARCLAEPGSGRESRQDRRGAVVLSHRWHVNLRSLSKPTKDGQGQLDCPSIPQAGPPGRTGRARRVPWPVRTPPSSPRRAPTSSRTFSPRNATGVSPSRVAAGRAAERGGEPRGGEELLAGGVAAPVRGG